MEAKERVPPHPFPRKPFRKSTMLSHFLNGSYIWAASGRKNGRGVLSSERSTEPEKTVFPQKASPLRESSAAGGDEVAAEAPNVLKKRCKKGSPRKFRENSTLSAPSGHLPQRGRQALGSPFGGAGA